MHNYPQSQSSVGSSGQTLTTNVHDSMQLANSSPNPRLMWLHYICTESNEVPNQHGPYAPLQLAQGRGYARHMLVVGPQS